MQRPRFDRTGNRLRLEVSQQLLQIAPQHDTIEQAFESLLIRLRDILLELPWYRS